MRTLYLLFALFQLIVVICRSQTPFFEPSNAIVVRSGLDTLHNAWAGGINSATISTFDFDLDGQNDLLLFDRQSNRKLIFIAKKNQYFFAPSLSETLPALTKYGLFYDFDMDGKKDIFTATTLGIKVYKNTSTSNSLSFKILKDPLFTQYYSATVNMDMSPSDIPAFTDIEGDGDMDILHFKSMSASLDLEVNTSIQLWGGVDSLQFKNLDYCYGGFAEYNCKTYLFGDPNKCKNSFRQERLEHAGAGAVLAIDLNKDGDKDLFLGKEDCTNLNFLENKGAPSSPLFNKLAPYPSSFPIDSLPFPLPFYEDVDFDGQKDMIATMGLSSPSLEVNLNHTIWMYKNFGTNDLPSFTSQPTKNFLQNTMIDLGTNTTPTFADVDGDGDLDLFIGYATNLSKSSAQIQVYENTGNTTQPTFSLLDTDYLLLSTANYDQVRITFADLNSDSKLDAITTTYKGQNRVCRLFYNDAPNGLHFTTSTPLDITLSEPSTIIFHDIDNDLLSDALVATEEGSLYFYKNTGTSITPKFTLSQNEYGGVSPNNTYSNSNLGISIVDIDNNGSLDLVTVDDQGHLSYYSDFKHQDPENFKSTSIITSLKQKDYLGEKLTLALADLNNDTHPEIVLGNANGGLQLFTFNSIVNDLAMSDLEPNDKGINVHPNPTDGPFEVTIPEHGDLKISDILGNTLFHLPNNTSLTVKCSRTIPPGIYFVYFHGHSGLKACQKLVVR